MRRDNGEVNLLLRQAERRFGPLAVEARARIEGADADTLRRWGINILSAETMDETFD